MPGESIKVCMCLITIGDVRQENYICLYCIIMLVLLNKHVHMYAWHFISADAKRPGLSV